MLYWAPLDGSPLDFPEPAMAGLLLDLVEGAASFVCVGNPCFFFRFLA